MFTSQEELFADKVVFKSYYKNGYVESETLESGKTIGYYNPEGTSYGEVGKKIKLYELQPDGTARGWFPDGIMQYEIIPGKHERHWDSKGNLYLEKLPNGIKRKYSSGKPIEEENTKKGTKTRWNDNGEVIYHATDGVEDTKTYLKNKESLSLLRKMVKKRIDERDDKNSNSDRKSYKPVIKNKLAAKLDIAYKTRRSAEK